MGNIDILKKYYKEVCTPLIFVNETSLTKLMNVKVYLYDFNKQQELENFKKVFQEYMTMYVRNDDIINLYDLSKNISEQLQKEFKKIYKTITPDRKTGVNGIFGELFNDYYLKNVYVLIFHKFLGSIRALDFLIKNSTCTPITFEI